MAPVGMILFSQVIFVVCSVKNTHGWYPLHKAIEHNKIVSYPSDVHVVLRYSGADITRLEQTLLYRSDPRSSRFRMWLNKSSIKDIVSPFYHEGYRKVVDEFVVQVLRPTFMERSPHGDYLHFDASALMVAEFFQVTLQEFGHESSHTTILNTYDSPVVPEIIAPYVTSVHNLGEFFPVPRPRRSSNTAKRDGDDPGMVNDPTTLRTRYKIGASVSGSGATQQGVAEFEGEQFIPSDVDTFMARFALPKVMVDVLGPNNGGYFGEGGLDLEYLSGLATHIPTWWIAQSQFDLLSWAHKVQNMTALPSVLSISWGSGESGFSAATANAVNAEFMKLGAAGVSVLAASGDDGTGSQGFLSCDKFDPTYPASLPYVTAVGGTYANDSSSAEVGWQASGGGFSAKFAAPSYQSNAIATYMNRTTLPPSALWSPGGRGTPDVSALATNFKVYSSGWGTESGTSAATPTFAAVVSLLNDQRVRAGKPTLGFLNPVLYQLGKVGTDPVSGNNQYGSCAAGFSAAPGWDAITGLGTPDFEYLSLNLLS